MSDLAEVKPKKIGAAKAKRTMYAPIAPAKQPFHQPPPAIYALTAWTVRKANGKWQIAPTAYFEQKPVWSKPYATLQRANHRHRPQARR